jgi:hypothetical protein
MVDHSTAWVVYKKKPDIHFHDQERFELMIPVYEGVSKSFRTGHLD